MDEGIRARLGLPALDQGKPRRDLRVFGFGLAALLTLLAALAWRKGSAAAPWELVLAAAAAAMGWLKPEALGPVYKPWMAAARVIGKANTFIAMALVYYLVITPYAVVIRLFDGDLLDEKFRDRDSYWHAKDGPPDRESYRHQY